MFIPYSEINPARELGLIQGSAEARFVFSRKGYQPERISDKFIGTIVGDMGRPHELIYVGAGIFVSTQNVFFSRTLWFENVEYRFQEFVPAVKTVRPLVTLYFVPELVEVGSDVNLPPFRSQKFVDIQYFKSDVLKKFSCRFSASKGMDGETASPEQCSQDAEEFGVRKFMPPPHYKFGLKSFMNELVSVSVGKREYPVVFSYHKYHDPSRNKRVGSVRMITSRIWQGEWIRV